MLPHSPWAGGRGWLPRLFDYTLSSDISQYNHFSISSAPNFAIITMHDKCELFASYTELLKSCLGLISVMLDDHEAARYDVTRGSDARASVALRKEA